MPGKSVPMITKEELAAQCNGHCLVTVENRKVYDVTSFLEEHPGGGDIITEYNGKDITEILKDPLSHIHSLVAYEMLDEMYFVAILATDEEAKKLLTDENRESFTLDKDAHDELYVTTDFNRDYEHNKFIDLNKPLLLQVLFAKYDKEFYLAQVHKPRHYGKGSAPIFGNFLEPISKTPWFLIPMLWIPADCYAISLALQGSHAITVLCLYMLGLFIWTLLEYCMHRFLFHIEYYLPDHPLAFTVHFLLHGVHHYLPMDRLRLVMPPTLLVALTTPFYYLAHTVFFYNYYHAMAVFAGAFMGYVMYDCCHYFLHHVNLPQFMKDMKKAHLDHHYKNYDLAYGVTSKFWDVIFGTAMSDEVDSRLLDTK
ncbi:hypothetical protein DS838_001490 [Geotrichum bryndzae]|nr:hypothetical protein DS838_001490 [Geotrichum bryndzae]